MIEKKNQPSKNQLDALQVMVTGKWYSAYELQISLATLESLFKKGFLKKQVELGAIHSPRTSIKFKKIV